MRPIRFSNACLHPLCADIWVELNDGTGKQSSKDRARAYRGGRHVLMEKFDVMVADDSSNPDQSIVVTVDCDRCRERKCTVYLKKMQPQLECDVMLGKEKHGTLRYQVVPAVKNRSVTARTSMCVRITQLHGIA